MGALKLDAIGNRKSFTLADKMTMSKWRPVMRLEKFVNALLSKMDLECLKITMGLFTIA